MYIRMNQRYMCSCLDRNMVHPTISTVANALLLLLLTCGGSPGTVVQAQVFKGCFDETRCGGNELPTDPIDTVSQIRECCLSDGGASYKIVYPYYLNYRCVDCGDPLVYLSLNGTTITTNNTEVFITDIGQDDPTSLTCHTNLRGCCRNSDGYSAGEWYYPDGTVVPNNAGTDYFARVKNAPQVVRLYRRIPPAATSPTGLYCCVIPTTVGEQTFCANLVLFSIGTHPMDQNLIVMISVKDVTFSVTVFGDDTVTYQWQKDGVNIRDSADTYSGTATPTLTVLSIALGDAGRYTCVVTGSVRTVTSNLAKLTIVCLDFTLINGNVQYTYPKQIPYVATFECDQGYELNGTSHLRVCSASGWTGDGVPNCLPVICGDPPNTPNGKHGVPDRDTFGGRVTYTCDTDFILYGSQESICLSSGKWSDPPLCRSMSPIKLALQGANYSANNTEILITNIGESVFSLSCQTDLSGCCRAPETQGAPAGVWYYPSGAVVAGRHYNKLFYVTRNLMEINLNRRNQTLHPTGNYCCSLPTSVGELMLCANIVVCRSLPPFVYGVISYSPANFPGGLGSVATYTVSCGSDSLKIVGDLTRTCQRNNTWSGVEPTCQIIDCGPLPNPTNGIVTYSSGTTYSSAVNYSCYYGFELVGNSRRTCDHNEQWIPSDNKAQCNAVDCGPPPALTHGISTTPNGTNFKSVAIYNCTSGYELNGGRIVTCEGDKRWTTPPVCNPVDCGPPPTLEKGSVSTVFGTTYLSTAHHVCSKGYILEGPAVRSCGPGGVWSPNAPSCTPIDCGRPYVPPNGAVDISSGTRLGNIATYSCDTGHNITGNVTRICQDDREWSFSAPYCADIALVQLKFSPTSHCVEWSETWAEQLYKIMRDSILKAIMEKGDFLVSMDEIGKGFFSCYRSRTETTYRTTITGLRGVSARTDLARSIQTWVESGATLRVKWFVIKVDESCPVLISSLDDDECM